MKRLLSKNRGATNPKKAGRLNETFLIESLKVVVDGIAGTFGSRCEVVLHNLRNLRNLSHSIIKIANGHVRGRAIGGAITDEGLRYLKSGRKEDLLINYSSRARDGKLLKSSTMMFRNKKKEPIVAICINFDITDIMNYHGVIEDIFKVSEDKREENLETFQ